MSTLMLMNVSQCLIMHLFCVSVRLSLIPTARTSRMSIISEAIGEAVEARQRGPKCPIALLLASLTPKERAELTTWLDGDAESSAISAGLNAVAKKREAEGKDFKLWLVKPDKLRRHRRPEGPPDGCKCEKKPL